MTATAPNSIAARPKTFTSFDIVAPPISPRFMNGRDRRLPAPIIPSGSSCAARSPARRRGIPSPARSGRCAAPGAAGGWSRAGALGRKAFGRKTSARRILGFAGAGVMRGVRGGLAVGHMPCPVLVRCSRRIPPMRGAGLWPAGRQRALRRCRGPSSWTSCKSLKCHATPETSRIRTVASTAWVRRPSRLEHWDDRQIRSRLGQGRRRRRWPIWRRWQPPPTPGCRSISAIFAAI